jgi:endonuclease/exonuclease/phosphatase family metal-dependent hydrolase
MHGLCPHLLSSLTFKHHPRNLPKTPKGHCESPSKWADVVPRTNIKLLTYNLFMRPPLIKTNASDFKEDRLREFAQTLDAFDIICCQEVFTMLNSRKQRLITYAKKAGLCYHAVCDQPSLLSGYFTDGGLLILSRFPIAETEFSPYPYGMLSDAISYKGVLYVKIMVSKSKVLHLFNTHTQATYFGIDANQFVSYFSEN